MRSTKRALMALLVALVCGLFVWSVPVAASEATGVEVDTDGDLIPDPLDECVEDPEDIDLFEDTDGCPEDDDGEKPCAPTGVVVDICGSVENDVIELDAASDGDLNGEIVVRLGAGDDTLCLGSDIQVPVTIAAGPGNDVVGKACEGSAPITDLHFTGGGGRDFLRGGRGDDVFAGMSGKDTLSSGAGDDTLRGGKGSDLLVGGRGGDALRGGPRYDACDAAPGPGDSVKGCETTADVGGPPLPPIEP